MPTASFSGPRLRAARRQAQIRPAVLAEAAGRTERTVRAYESGYAQPPIRIATQLAAALGLELADLLTPTRKGEGS